MLAKFSPFLKLGNGLALSQGDCGMYPFHPRLPTLVGRGFAGVLGPTRGGVAGVGNSPPLLVFGGTSPNPLPGGCAPWTPVCPPSLAEGLPAFWAPLVAGLQGLATRPSLGFWGHIPQTPCQGAVTHGPPFAHPRWPRVCLGFGPHPWAG